MEIEQNIRITVDAVVFGYNSEKVITVLLIKRKFPPYEGSWALPGGFVRDNESLEEAVERELSEETGVTINYLEQLYSFGSTGRDPRNRVISVAYFALIQPEAFNITPNIEVIEARWFNIKDLPSLAFDHQTIIETAIKRLRAKVTYEPIGFELLNEKFPFSDLEHLYTTLLDRNIDRRNFRKKILSFGLLEELNEKISKGSGRPANLFQFNKDKYFQLKQEGITFEI